MLPETKILSYALVSLCAGESECGGGLHDDSQRAAGPQRPSGPAGGHGESRHVPGAPQVQLAAREQHRGRLHPTREEDVLLKKLSWDLDGGDVGEVTWRLKRSTSMKKMTDTSSSVLKKIKIESKHGGKECESLHRGFFFPQH